MNIQKKILSIGVHPSGVDLNVVYYELENGDGPNLYIQGGIHGGEITYWIIENIYNYLLNNNFKGKVILVPVANPIAWFQRTYYNTSGKFDLYMGKDWNRNFPGNAEGTLGERLAYGLFNLSKDCDYIVDLHTSRKSFPFSMISDTADIEIAKSLGIEYIYLEKEQYITSKYKGTYTDYMRYIGIPALTIECGSHDDYNKSQIDLVTSGLINLMKKIEILNGAHENIKLDYKIYSQIVSYNAPVGGFCIYHKLVGEKYSIGDLLYEISNPNDLGNAIKVYAKENGIVQKTSPTHIMYPGDQVLDCIASYDVS